MDPEGTRNDAPPTVVDMSLSAIHGSTNGSGRKDSACRQDFQITLRTARRAPPGPEPFAGTRKPDMRQKAPDRASSVPESQQERPRRTIYPPTVRKPPLAAPGHFLSVRTSLHLPPVLTPANNFPPFAPHQSSPHPAAPHVPSRPRRSPPSIRILALPPRAGNPFRARRPASAPCAPPPKCRKISARTKKFRRRTLHSLRFLLSLHPL